jgi:tripartite-type tricarboxylate transporter receptor subunit TctC
MATCPAPEAGFYEGKRIKVVVGSRPGVAYDLYARLIAGHLGKYIRGTPSVVVENMTGASSRIVANCLYRAEPDGLTLGAISPDLYFPQLLGQQDVAFDWSRFSWIGTPDRSNHLLYMRADRAYQSIEEIARASEPPRCGASAAYSTSYYLPKLLEETLGAKFTMVTGYQEGPDVDSAVERGEIDCRALTISGFFSHEPYPGWRKNGFVRVLLQTGKARDPRLPEAPTIYELMDQYQVSESGRRLARVILSSALFGRPLVAPPGVPGERVKILREAFIAAARDSELLTRAKTKGLEVVAADGEELERLAGEILSQPPEVIERLRKLAER